MHCLIVGSNGLLGREMVKVVRQQTTWNASTRTRAELDISCGQAVETVVELRPDVVINCAAWTQVDAAESDPEAAFAANALGARHLAQACSIVGATLVQVSTNEVFAGQPGIQYFEHDQPSPRSVYARSKHAGEMAVQNTLAAHYIVRVAWLFGPGNNHFPAKMVAAADRHGVLRVVDDEIGNPTYTLDVAEAIVKLVETGRYGIYHLINEGATSRFELARAMLSQTGRGDVPLTPISLTEWPRPAPPPRHAVLINQAAVALGIRLRPWQDALAEYVAEAGTQFDPGNM